MGAGVAVSGQSTCSPPTTSCWAPSPVEVVGIDGRDARGATASRSTTRAASRCSPSRRARPRAGAARPRARAAAGRPGVPAHLHRREGAPRRERPRHLRRAVRGVLGVHARPRDHDHDGQPRPGRRTAVRRARPRGRHRLAGPRRGGPLQPGHPDRAVPASGGRASRAAGPGPTERRAWLGFYPQATTTASPSRASCRAARPRPRACSAATCS